MKSNAIVREDPTVPIVTDSNAKVNEIAAHYNQKKDSETLKSRDDSRIVFLRNFNNWIKSVIIQETISQIRHKRHNRSRPINVVDLGCGRGGDMQKWIRACVNYVLFTDIAENSLEECERRYLQNRSRRRMFACDYVHMDATVGLLNEKIDLASRHINLVSCQFVLHYSFESYKQANVFLKNVSDSLEIGGHFIGTTTDSYEIVRRLNESDTNSFGNSVYKVTYLGNKNERIPLFGAKFDFELEGVVNCPEYLVYFPLLVRLAEKYKLKLIARQTFAELFSNYSLVPSYKNLIVHMKSLEPYRSDDLTCLKGDIDLDYGHMKDKNSNDSELFTMSQAEWEAATLYIAFSFVKIA